MSYAGFAEDAIQMHNVPLHFEANIQRKTVKRFGQKFVNEMKIDDAARYGADLYLYIAKSS